MTTIKLDSKLPTTAVPDDLAKTMWDGLGTRYMAIVEVRVAERTEPADSLDTDPSAKIRVTLMEFAADSADAERLRQALRDRWAARTAADTLQDEGLTHDRTNPDVGFHDGLLAHLTDRGHLAGYPLEVEMTPDGGLALTIGPTKTDQEDDADVNGQGTLDDAAVDEEDRELVST